jgi:predicted methyltransferase
MKKKNNFTIYFFITFFSLIYTKLSYAQSLESVINSKNRTISYTERDIYRNPLKTLNFFKIKNNMKVIELQPSGGNSPGGWYTEILAPYLKSNGLLIAAHFNPKESEWRARMRNDYEKRIKTNEDFNKIQMAVLSMPPDKLSQDNSVDMVLTFRNLHNWLKAGYLKEVFEVSYKA